MKPLWYHLLLTGCVPADFMDNMKELVTLQKPIILDGSNFGHWKARMQHLIRGINEDAWTAVEEG